MEIKQLDPDFSVAGQIEATDVKAIADAGYKSLICNRPDTEEGAVAHGEIETAANAAGLVFSFIPVVSGQITPQDVDDMAAALAKMPKPVLAYCRTGGRCTNLYGLVKQAG